MDARYWDVHVVRRDQVCLPNAKYNLIAGLLPGYAALIVFWGGILDYFGVMISIAAYLYGPITGLVFVYYLVVRNGKLDLRRATNGRVRTVAGLHLSLTAGFCASFCCLRCDQLHRASSALQLHHFKPPGIPPPATRSASRLLGSESRWMCSWRPQQPHCLIYPPNPNFEVNSVESTDHRDAHPQRRHRS
jgi:hypothetical protein